MPLTQYDLADIVGISPVHVNRVLQTLRGEGLIDLKGRWLQVRDLEALQRLGEVPSETAVPLPRAA
jgi:DNA-binding GntR family transcriptional regulator